MDLHGSPKYVTWDTWDPSSRSSWWAMNWQLLVLCMWIMWSYWILYKQNHFLNVSFWQMVPAVQLSRWSCQNILVHISECLTSMMPINLVMQNWWRIQKRQCDSYVNPQCIPQVVLASWSILVHACNPWSSCLDHLDPFARCKADEVVQDVVKRIQSGAQRCVAREPILLLRSEVDVWFFTIFSLPKVSGQSS